ncbi:unnamed protein product, partial [Ixodes pacificus]
RVISLPRLIRFYSNAATETERVVTWVTLDKTKESAVEYGVSTTDAKASGYASSFVDGGPKKRSMYIHRVVIRNLTHGVTYRKVKECRPKKRDSLFRVGYPKQYQDSLEICCYLGSVRSTLLPTTCCRDKDETTGASASLFYFDNEGRFEGLVGEGIRLQLSPSQGLELRETFVGRSARMCRPSAPATSRLSSLPQPAEGRFGQNSPEKSPTLCTKWSTGYAQRAEKAVSKKEPRETEEKEANLPENRNMRPWIITISHHPMYCSNKGERDCNLIDSLVRTGLGSKKKYALEKLFRKYGVDLQFTGHQHSYERTWPIFNYTV